VRKSRDSESKLQPDSTWQPTLIDYISLNDQVHADNRSINTRIQTLSNKLSDVNYSKQNQNAVKKYRPSE